MRGWTWIAAAMALGLVACSDRNADGNTTAAAKATATQPGLATALSQASGLGSTARMVKQAGLDRALDGVGSYTLFAPTDAALAALPEAERRRLATAAGRPQLVALLRQHIAPGFIARADLDRGLTRDGRVRVATVGSGPIVVRKEGEVIVLGSGTDAPRLTGTPIVARNGVIFPIDRVLPPPKRS